MQRSLLITLLLFATLLAGCSAPTLDTSSDEAFKASLQSMAEGLNEQEKQQLAGSIVLIGMKGAFSGKRELAIYEEYQGWTAEQLIEEGRQMAERVKTKSE